MMERIFRIPLFKLFIINKIREIRLELGISGAELSKVVSPSGHEKFIATIEASKNSSTYTEHTLNLIADAFTERAREIQSELDSDYANTLQIKTSYTVHDFFPPEPLPDILVEKIIAPLPTGSGPAATLNHLLETDPFFNTLRTVREIADYCNQYKNQHWPDGNFTGLCFRLWKNNQLIRVEVGDKDIRYRKNNRRKK